MYKNITENYNTGSIYCLCHINHVHSIYLFISKTYLISKENNDKKLGERTIYITEITVLLTVLLSYIRVLTYDNLVKRI